MKYLIAIVLALALSSCAGNFKKSKVQNADSVKQEEVLTSVPNNPQDFNAIESEVAAKEINEKTQEKIEEVEVDDRIFFDLNQSSISEAGKKVLENQVAWLKSETTIKVIIEGHCDERGTREYNLALGEKRANSVKQYLITGGIESSRIKIISFGKEKPEFVGEGEEIWNKNRRAVTIVEEK